MMRKIILYISMSLDGFIAGENDSIDFLSKVQGDENEDYGYNEFNKLIDTVIVGGNTYKKVLSMGYEYPHADKKVYILSNSLKALQGNFQIYSGPITELVNRLKKEEGSDIYCDGGAQIISQLLENDLIDEMIISSIPVLLCRGTRLFNGNYPLYDMNLISSKSYKSGLVQNHYKILHERSLA